MKAWVLNKIGEIFDDWGYVIGKLREHRISPRDIISHTFPLEGLEQGLLLMRDKKEEYGKVMIIL